jgi:hypothetical protein
MCVSQPRVACIHTCTLANLPLPLQLVTIKPPTFHCARCLAQRAPQPPFTHTLQLEPPTFHCTRCLAKGPPQPPLTLVPQLCSLRQQHQQFGNIRTPYLPLRSVPCRTRVAAAPYSRPTAAPSQSQQQQQQPAGTSLGGSPQQGSMAVVVAALLARCAKLAHTH